MTRYFARFILLALTPLLSAQPRFNEELLSALKYRNIGPFRAGGWIADIAVPEAPQNAHLYTFYAAGRNGGVWKTTNNGDTFEPIFDTQDVMNIGALAVSPSDANTVWVGTGDAFFARSPYFGDGVYKSTDGGKNWEHLGLEDTQHIARIAIDRENPNIVYIAAAGHAYTPNAERGVFKTSDGGKTWTKSLYIDDHTAAIDLAIDPKNPKVLYAATWYRPTRKPGDPPPDRNAPPDPNAPVETRGGIYKTIDAGKTWNKLAGGLPATRLGRIGLALYAKNPNILYAIVDNQGRRPLTEAEKTRSAGRGGRGDGAAANGGGARSNAAPNETAIGNEIYRTSDAGRTWLKMNATEDDPGSKAPQTFTQLRVDTDDPNRIYSLTSNLLVSEDGGKTWPGLHRVPQNDYQDGGENRQRRAGILLERTFGDFRTLWIDPQNSKRWLIGSDGGVFASYDGGLTSEHYNNIPLGEINGMAVDMDNPYHIYVGEQDHEHWKGPVNSWSGGVGPEDWFTVGIQDGENDQVDPTDSRWLYTTSENGQHMRMDQKTYTRTSIQPRLENGPPLRFNWIAPIRLSPHDPAILYTGAQLLLRSMDRGDHWQAISPDLTIPVLATNGATAGANSVTVNGAGPVLPAGSGPVSLAGGGPILPASGGRGTITTICESPVSAGLIWVGSQNGRVQVTRNAGEKWTDVTSNIAQAGGPEDAYVTRIVASKFRAGRAYVAKSRYGQDDPRPFLYETADFGATWESIAANLPQRSINVVAEDTLNANLLFVGTDGGAYASIDGGKRWVSIRGNMPEVSVMDLLVHPRESDLVLGSYGRGLWIVNIALLREMTEENLAKDAYFFSVRPEAPRDQRAMGNYRFTGTRNLVTPNEPNGVTAYFYLRDVPKDPVTLTVSDAAGKELRRLTAKAKPGLNHILWDMRSSQRQALSGGNTPALAPSGDYVMTLQVGEQKLTQKAHILERVIIAP